MSNGRKLVLFVYKYIQSNEKFHQIKKINESDFFTNFIIFVKYNQISIR